MDFKLLDKMVADGYVSKRKHDHADLFIYNYTNNTQFEGKWNEITLQCRGLILDNNGNVVARPFQKFFNLDEYNSPMLSNVPTNESFEVYEKLDGSLGILYWLNDKPHISTRGSFHSNQAQRAQKILEEKYSHCTENLDRSKTYLLEIIYPENRIVVDYGKQEKLVLLAIIDNDTGLDSCLVDVGFPLVKTYNGIKDYNSLSKLDRDNFEGFVIKFQSGFRAKIKLAEYVRLHRILTNISNKSIWECLRYGNDLDEIINNVPDEFYNWVKSVKSALLREYEIIESKCRLQFKDLGDRKQNALYYQTCDHAAILFKMLDKKDYSDMIWKLIRPKYECPFKETGE